MRKIICFIISLFIFVESIYAGEWIQNGELWSYKEDDGNIAISKWITYDSDNDGKKEYYYFNEVGIMLVNTITPDGYQVNEKGQWIENGIVKQENQNNGYLVAGNQESKLTETQKIAAKVAVLYIKTLPELSEKKLNKQVKYHMSKIKGYQYFSIDDAIAAVKSCNVDWNDQAVKAGKKYIKTFNPDADVEEVEYYLNEICEYTKQTAKTASNRALKEFLKNDYYIMSDDDFIADFVSSGFTEEEAKKALREVKKQNADESDANNGVHP